VWTDLTSKTFSSIKCWSTSRHVWRLIPVPHCDVIGAGVSRGGWPGEWREFLNGQTRDDTVLAFVASSDTKVGELCAWLVPIDDCAYQYPYYVEWLGTNYAEVGLRGTLAVTLLALFCLVIVIVFIFRKRLTAEQCLSHPWIAVRKWKNRTRIRPQSFWCFSL
jgi:hypothetical protein